MAGIQQSGDINSRDKGRTVRKVSGSGFSNVNGMKPDNMTLSGTETIALET